MSSTHFRAQRVRWCVLALLVLSAAVAAAKPRVSVIMSRSIAPYRKALEGFTQQFECETTVFDLQEKRDPAVVAKEIRASNPDLVLAIGSPGLNLAKKHLGNLPVVFTMVLKPGKLPPTMAGVSMVLPAKVHLEGLKLVAPSVKTVGIVYNPAKSSQRVEEFRKAGDTLGMKIVAVAAADKKESFSNIKLLGGRVDALWMVMDQDTVANFNLLYSISIKEKIPLATFSHKYVATGALLALSLRYEQLGRQAGELAQDILTGTPASKLGVASPTKYYYAINVETALKIEVGVPPAVLKKDHKTYPSK